MASQGARLCVYVMKVCANKKKKHSSEVSRSFCLSSLAQFVVVVWRLDGVTKRQGL